MSYVDSNCIGYTFHELGLQEQDLCINPTYTSSLEEQFGIQITQVPLHEAQVAAALERRESYVTHMAVIDPDSNGLRVSHRPHFQADIIFHVLIKEAFAGYIACGDRVVGLTIEKVQR